MQSNQPNFEILKTAFYQKFVGSDKADCQIVMERLYNTSAPLFHTRSEQFKKDLNQWLDRIDIRQSGTLIEVLKEHNASIPKWMKEKKYFIDYNDKGLLDLQKIDQDY